MSGPGLPRRAETRQSSGHTARPDVHPAPESPHIHSLPPRIAPCPPSRAIPARTAPARPVHQSAQTPLTWLAYEEQSLTEREQSNRRTIESARAYLTPEQVTIMENAMHGLNETMRGSLRARRTLLEGGR
jgi:hypothetical protein